MDIVVIHFKSHKTYQDKVIRTWRISRDANITPRRLTYCPVTWLIFMLLEGKLFSFESFLLSMRIVFLWKALLGRALLVGAMKMSLEQTRGSKVKRNSWEWLTGRINSWKNSSSTSVPDMIIGLSVPMVRCTGALRESCEVRCTNVMNLSVATSEWSSQHS